MSVFGEELKKIRVSRILKISRFASLLNVDLSTYSDIERGNVRSRSKIARSLLRNPLFTKRESAEH